MRLSVGGLASPPVIFLESVCEKQAKRVFAAHSHPTNNYGCLACNQSVASPDFYKYLSGTNIASLQQFVIISYIYYPILHLIYQNISMPPQHVDAKSVFNDIEEHNAYFDDLVDMFPANYYVVDNSSSDHQAKQHTKHQKTQGKDSKEAKHAQKKIAKLNKYDPNQPQESTREKKKRMEQSKDEESSDDDASMGDIQFEDNHEEEQEEEAEQSPQTPSMSATANAESPKSKSSSHQSRIEELKAKLRAKLEERRSNAVTNSTSDAIVSKRAARRAEKKRKIELAKRREASGPQSKVSGGSTITTKNGVASIKIVKNLGGSKINASAEAKAQNVMDDLSGIDFGGIAGLKDNLLTKGNYSSVNKSLKNKGKKKSLERLLEEAEAKKERLRQLKESDDLEDKEKAKNIQWGDALKAARYVLLYFITCL